MGLFNEEMDEITCDKCGKTLKNHKDSKDRHLCTECYLKILNK